MGHGMLAPFSGISFYGGLSFSLPPSPPSLSSLLPSPPSLCLEIQYGHASSTDVLRIRRLSLSHPLLLLLFLTHTSVSLSSECVGSSLLCGPQQPTKFTLTHLPDEPPTAAIPYHSCCSLLSIFLLCLLPTCLLRGHSLLRLAFPSVSRTSCGWREVLDTCVTACLALLPGGNIAHPKGNHPLNSAMLPSLP